MNAPKNMPFDYRNIWGARLRRIGGRGGEGGRRNMRGKRFSSLMHVKQS